MRRALIVFAAVVGTALALGSWLGAGEPRASELPAVHPRHTVPQSWDGLNEAIDRHLFQEAAWYKAVTPTTTTTTRPRVTSATRPPDSPVRATQTEGCQWAGTIRAVFGGAGDWAVAIAMRESRCVPSAASPTGCLGLFQLCWPLHADLERAACGRSDRAGLFDPACNIAAAKRLYDGSGTAPWRL